MTDLLRLLATTRDGRRHLYQIGIDRPSGRPLVILADQPLARAEEAAAYEAVVLDELADLLDRDDWVLEMRPITRQPRRAEPAPDWTADATVGPLRLLATSPGGDRFLYQVGIDALSGRPLAIITWQPIDALPDPDARNVKIIDNILKFISLDTWTVHAQPEVGPSHLKRS